MKKIIVVGYPRSGNTWLTRLTAELVGCPVVGFWHYPDIDEKSCEGENRKSDFECFKSYHQLHELEIENNSDKHYIIYLIRDPRDVAISGANSFQFNRWKQIADFFQTIPKGKNLYNRTIYKIANPKNYRINQMMNAILHGSRDVHYWCRIPWKSHYKPYMESGCLFIRYEDLISSPENECQKILQYLGLYRQESQIKQAIENQSFHKKKSDFIRKGEKTKAALMRIQRSGQWKQKLSKKQKKEFLELLQEDFEYFSYETKSSR